MAATVNIYFTCSFCLRDLRASQSSCVLLFLIFFRAGIMPVQISLHRAAGSPGRAAGLRPRLRRRAKGFVEGPCRASSWPSSPDWVLEYCVFCKAWPSCIRKPVFAGHADHRSGPNLVVEFPAGYSDVRHAARPPFVRTSTARVYLRARQLQQRYFRKRLFRNLQQAISIHALHRCYTWRNTPRQGVVL